LIILVIYWEEYMLWTHHYAVFSNLLSLHPSSVKIFTLTPSSQTPSVYVPPLMSETKFQTHTEQSSKSAICKYITMSVSYTIITKCVQISKWKFENFRI
jgi:hypothetical protein